MFLWEDLLVLFVSVLCVLPSPKVQRCVLWCVGQTVVQTVAQMMCKSMHNNVPSPWILTKKVSWKYTVKLSGNQWTALKFSETAFAEVPSFWQMCLLRNLVEGSALQHQFSFSGKAASSVCCAVLQQCNIAVQRLTGGEILAKVAGEAWAASPDKWYHTWPVPTSHHHCQ